MLNVIRENPPKQNLITKIKAQLELAKSTNKINNIIAGASSRNSSKRSDKYARRERKDQAELKPRLNKSFGATSSGFNNREASDPRNYESFVLGGFKEEEDNINKLNSPYLEDGKSHVDKTPILKMNNNKQLKNFLEVALVKVGNVQKPDPALKNDSSSNEERLRKMPQSKEETFDEAKKVLSDSNKMKLKQRQNKSIALTTTNEYQISGKDAIKGNVIKRKQAEEFSSQHFPEFLKALMEEITELIELLDETHRGSIVYSSTKEREIERILEENLRLNLQLSEATERNKELEIVLQMKQEEIDLMNRIKKSGGNNKEFYIYQGNPPFRSDGLEKGAFPKGKSLLESPKRRHYSEYSAKLEVPYNEYRSREEFEILVAKLEALREKNRDLGEENEILRYEKEKAIEMAITYKSTKIVNDINKKLDSLNIESLSASPNVALDSSGDSRNLVSTPLLKNENEQRSHEKNISFFEDKRDTTPEREKKFSSGLNLSKKNITAFKFLRPKERGPM